MISPVRNVMKYRSKLLIPRLGCCTRENPFELRLAGPAYLHSVTAISIGMFLVNLVAGIIWIGFGAMIGRILRSRRAWTIFNLAMGLLTAACVLLIWR